jgi:3'-5' exonuclease
MARLEFGLQDRHPGFFFSIPFSSVPILVFDIETSASATETLDAVQLEYLFRDAERLPTEDERALRRQELTRQMSLWPLTARVVCVAMLNLDSQRGQVLYQIGPGETEAAGGEPVRYVPCADEAAILTAFWRAALRFDRVVTFNGRGFDVPFLYLRSALLDLPISRKDWLGYRFQSEPHCDLAEQLTFYGVSGREGAARRFNLDFYCRAFGIESPKRQGVTGMDVDRLMSEGRYRDIAEYCARDVEATAQLYRVWQQRLSGIR